MLKSCFLLFAFFGGVTVFLTGAWSGSFTPPASGADTHFVPESIALDRAICATEATAAELLDQAIARLTRATWLKTKVRQRMTHAESSFVANGLLQMGPRHCARLEMTVQTAGIASRLLIVSDGDVVAQEQTIGAASPVVVCERLPADAQGARLTEKGCGGPAAVLGELRTSLRNLQMQTGRLDGRSAVQIKGDAASDEPLAIRHGVVYLDAKTLWPHRVEWRGARQFMQMEFHEYEVDQALSIEECVRAFSYQPQDPH